MSHWLACAVSPLFLLSIVCSLLSLRGGSAGRSTFYILHSPGVWLRRAVRCWMLDVGRSASAVPQKASLWLLTHRHPPGPLLLTGRQSRRSPAVASPETRRSTSDRVSEVLRRVSGESPARPARAPGAVSERIAGGLIVAIWQPHHKGFRASHWQPGTCGAYDSLHLDSAKSLLGVQISIPGSDRVRPP